MKKRSHIPLTVIIAIILAAVILSNFQITDDRSEKLQAVFGWVVLLLSLLLILLAVFRYDLFQRYFYFLGYWRFPNFFKLEYLYIPASKFSAILGLSICFNLGLLTLMPDDQKRFSDMVITIFITQSIIAIPMAISDYRKSRREPTKVNNLNSPSSPPE